MPKREIPSERRIDIFSAVDPIRVKYSDVIDLREFYGSLHEWLLEHEWKDESDSQDHYETFFGERIDQRGSKELWIQWRMKKKAPSSEAFAHYMDIFYHCICITPLEVVKEGKKLKIHKGIVEMKISASIEEVYKKNLEKSVLAKPFIKLFAKRVYRQVTEQQKKELYQECYALQNFMKQYMKMKRYMPYEESRSFFPSMAWPTHQQETAE